MKPHQTIVRRIYRRFFPALNVRKPRLQLGALLAVNGAVKN